MVLVVHNRYRSDSPSGENAVVERELALLSAGPGPPPQAWITSSDALSGSPFAKLRALAGLHAGPRRVAELRARLASTGERILHAHNLWPGFGLGVIEAARQAGMRTVLTAHNYRLFASNHRLFGPAGARRPRDAGERDRLIRMHAAHPNPLADLAYTHALGGYWRRGVVPDAFDAVVCMTSLHRRLLAQAGVPDDRLVLKPHVLDHHGPIGPGPGDHALFVGRLDHGKGVSGLLQAWAGIPLPLRIAGSGPLEDRLAWSEHVRPIGRLDGDGVARAMAEARFLVMNPQWYETFGLVVIEAFAAGTPCLVPHGCCPADLVDAGVTGLLFDPDDADDLRRRVREMWDLAPTMRAACRAAYERHYTPERGLGMALRLYDNLAHARRPDSGVLHADAVPLRPAGR